MSKNEKCETPKWAKNLEKWGKEQEKKHKDQWQPVGNIFSIFFIVLFAYLVNKYWNHFSFFTESFNAVLWVYNLSIAASVLSNLIQALINNQIVRKLCRLGENIFSIAVLATLNSIFPFSVSTQTAQMLHVVFILSIFFIALGTIVTFFKTLFRPEN